MGLAAVVTSTQEDRIPLVLSFPIETYCLGQSRHSNATAINRSQVYRPIHGTVVTF